MTLVLWIVLSGCILLAFHYFLSLVSKGNTDLANSLHLVRRLQHFGSGFLLIIIYSQLSHVIFFWVLLFLSISLGILDTLRRRVFPGFNEWFLKNWRSLLRPHEIEDRPPGGLFFLWGTTALLLITSRRTIVYVSLLNLSICDPMASICGILIKSPKITSSKSLSGTVAAGVCGGLISLLFVDFGILTLCYALIALLSEFLTVPGLDDNFTIPVVSGILHRIFILI